jgi:Holliday junction resolvase-like predicted endonuclease
MASRGGSEASRPTEARFSAYRDAIVRTLGAPARAPPVIAQMRQRSRADFGGAAAGITPAKRRRILRAARHPRLCRPALGRLAVRFDARLIDGSSGAIEWIEAAFDAAT